MKLIGVCVCVCFENWIKLLNIIYEKCYIPRKNNSLQGNASVGTGNAK